MSAVSVLWVLALFFGALLVLAGLPAMQRRGLSSRLAPYLAGRRRREGSPGLLSPASFSEVLAPLCENMARRILAAAGQTESLQRRLELVHSNERPADIRLRQFTVACATAGVAALVSLVVEIPPLASLPVVLGAAAAAAVAVERGVHSAAEQRRRQLLAELPVVAEQITMLISAGHSIPGALARLAERGSGAVSQDLVRVCGRIRQGLGTTEALREWAALAELPALDRVVSALAFEREGAQIAQLVSEQARAVREERQQRLIEQIQRRNQKVWIPVTVAALVPGILFLAVPFIDALEGVVS